MLKLTVHLQGWHSSFSQAFHQEYNLQVIYFHPRENKIPYGTSAIYVVCKIPSPGYWFSPRRQLYMAFRLFEVDARFSDRLSVFTPKWTNLYMATTMLSLTEFYLGFGTAWLHLTYEISTRWQSEIHPKGWALIDRPTLRSLLIAKASHSFHLILHNLHCVALRRKAEGREVLLCVKLKAKKVLSCEMPNAKKVLSAKCRRQRKSCRAKCQRQRKSCRA